MRDSLARPVAGLSFCGSGCAAGSGLKGWGWVSSGALDDDERDEEHRGGGVEGGAGKVEDGVGSDGFAEDVGEEAGAEESGDAAEAVDGSLELALFGRAGFAGEKTLGARPGEGHHVE